MTRPRIGQILMQQRRCNREALMRAWEQKVLFGDRLGTNLLALGAIDEESLAQALGIQAGVHAAWGEVIAVDVAAKRLLSPFIAKKRKVVPHHVEGQHFYYLTPDPHDQAAAAEIKAATQLQPVPVVVCEVRMWELQNEHYGVAIGMRPIDLRNPALRLQKAQQEPKPKSVPAPELTSEDEFHALYHSASGQQAADFDPDASLVVAELPVAELQPVAELPVAELPVAELPVAELPVAELPVAELPVAELQPVDEVLTVVEDRSAEIFGNVAYDEGPASIAEQMQETVADDMNLLTLTDEVIVQGEHSSEAPVELYEKADVSPEPSSSSVEVQVDELAANLHVTSITSATDATSNFAKPTLITEIEDATTDLSAALDPLPETSIEGTAQQNLSETPLSFDEATVALQEVKGRSEIARIVLRYALTGFSRAALLTVHPRNILGWEGIGDDVTTARLATLRLPRDVKSVFSLVAESRAHYIGPLQRWPGNGAWVKHTGRVLPQSVAVFPVLVRGKVVNLLYGDNGHGEHVQSDVGELLILAQRIAASYESLIRR